MPLSRQHLIGADTKQFTWSNITKCQMNSFPRCTGTIPLTARRTWPPPANPQVEKNLFRSTENVVLNKVLGYKIHGEKHTFLEDY